MSVRSEGLEIRAASRSFEKSHTTIIGWEERFTAQAEKWSPSSVKKDVTVEGVGGQRDLKSRCPPTAFRR